MNTISPTTILEIVTNWKNKAYLASFRLAVSEFYPLLQGWGHCHGSHPVHHPTWCHHPKAKTVHKSTPESWEAWSRSFFAQLLLQVSSKSEHFYEMDRMFHKKNATNPSFIISCTWQFLHKHHETDYLKWNEWAHRLSSIKRFDFTTNSPPLLSTWYSCVSLELQLQCGGHTISSFVTK